MRSSPACGIIAEGVQTIYVDAARHDRRMRELIERAETANVAVQAVDERRLQAMAGHDRHQGVVAVVDGALPHVTLEDVLEGAAEPPLLLVLDGVTDPHNLGACLRSADAFGVHALIVPKDRAVGRQRDGRQGGFGRRRYGARRQRHQPRADDARLEGARRLARRCRCRGSENLFEADLAGPMAWVLGAEGIGLAASDA